MSKADVKLVLRSPGLEKSEKRSTLQRRRKEIGIITINRLDRLNALNKELLGESKGLTESLKSDD